MRGEGPPSRLRKEKRKSDGLLQFGLYYYRRCSPVANNKLALAVSASASVFAAPRSTTTTESTKSAIIWPRKLRAERRRRLGQRGKKGEALVRRRHLFGSAFGEQRRSKRGRRRRSSPPPLLESSSLPDIFLEMMISERGGEGPPASASHVAEITSPRGFDRLQFPLEAALSLFRPLLPPAEAVRGLKRKEMVEALVSFWERRGKATAARGGPCSGPRASRSSPSRAGRFSARSWWFRGRRAGAAGFA